MIRKSQKDRDRETNTETEDLVLGGLHGRQKVLLPGVDGNDDNGHSHKEAEHGGVPESRVVTHAETHIPG